MAICFCIRVPSLCNTNFTSTVSLWRSEIAVCSHLNRTCHLCPNGSGPTSNWRKFSINAILLHWGLAPHPAMIDLQEEFETGLAIARQAGEIAMRYYRTGIAFEAKPDDSPVTRADRECEQFIARELERAFPDDGLLGEEGAQKPSRNGRRWIIDPIDGTRDFVRGNPAWANLIGLEAGGEVVAGFACMPALGELFSASRGGGAFVNGQRMQVS